MRLRFLRSVSVGFLAIGVAHFFPAIAIGAEKFEVAIEETTKITAITQYGVSVSVSAKAILPDGSHADLFCGGMDEHCGRIEPFFPERMPVNSTECTNVARSTVCTTKNIGKLYATRNENVLTIFAANGRLKFKIIGSW